MSDDYRDPDKAPLGWYVHEIVVIEDTKKIKRQGCIWNMTQGHDQTYFVVVWYSWFDGEVCDGALITLADIATDQYMLYPPDLYDKWRARGDDERNRA